MLINHTRKALSLSIFSSLRSMSNSSERAKNPFAKEKLPELQEIELIGSKYLDVEAHLSPQKTKYGDCDFFVTKDGYILSYIQAYLKKKEPEEVFYGVFYGRDHPLNSYGSVKGSQRVEHARETAILRLIEGFPNIEAKKLCICTNCTHTVKIMGRFELWSEIGMRSTRTGNILRNSDTYTALDRALRTRNDIQIRMLYTPDAVRSIKDAEKLAKLASKVD